MVARPGGSLFRKAGEHLRGPIEGFLRSLGQSSTGRIKLDNADLEELRQLPLEVRTPDGFW